MHHGTPICGYLPSMMSCGMIALYLFHTMHPRRSRVMTDRNSIYEHFHTLPDPRIERTKLHDLHDILTIALCAVICGADGWEDMAEFGHAKYDWLLRFIPLPNGIPSHDTFGRVFARLDPQQFQACFRRWIQAVAQRTNGQILPIDGKTLRHSYTPG